MNDSPSQQEQVPAQAQTPSSLLKRRRWKRTLFFSLAIVVLLGMGIAFLGPLLIASIARAKIIEELEKNLNGTAEIESLRFSWSGNIHIMGLRFREKGGDVPLVAVKSIHMDVALGAALRGKYVAAITVTEPALLVRRRSDGFTSHEIALSRSPDLETKPPSADQSSPERLPQVDLKFNVVNGAVILLDERTGQRGEFRQVNLSVGVDGWDTPMAFDLRFLGDSKDGSAGEGRIYGELAFARAGQLDWDALKGRLNVALSRLSLENLGVLAAMAGPVEQVKGLLEVNAECDVVGRMGVKGHAQITLDHVDVRSPALAGTVQIPSAKILLRSDLDSTGSGTLAAQLNIPHCFDGTVDVLARTLTAENRSMTCSAEAGILLRGASDYFPELLRLKPGYRLDGKISLGARVDVGFDEKGLERAVMDATVSGNDLKAMDERGKEIPIESKSFAKVKGSYSAASRSIELDEGILESSSMTARMKGSFGTSGELSPRDSSVVVNADLGALSDKLNSFMDLGGIACNGLVKIDARMLASDKVLPFEGTALVQRLEVRNLGPQRRMLGPFDLSIVSAGILDPREKGVFKIEKFDLQSSAFDIRLAGWFTDHEWNGQGTAVFHPVEIGRLAKDFMGGLDLAGSDVTALLAYRRVGEETKLEVVLKAPETAFIEDRAGRKLRRVRDFEASFKASVQADSIRSATLILPAVTVSAEGTFSNLAVNGSVDPAAVAARYGEFLDGIVLDGEPVLVHATLSERSPLSVTGNLEAKSLACMGGMFGVQGIRQRALTATFDVAAQEGGFNIRAFRVMSETGTLSVQGVVQNLEVRERRAASLHVSAEGQLAQMTRDLAGALHIPEGYEATGAMTVKGTLSGQDGRLHGHSEIGLTNIVLSGKVLEGKTVSEPKVSITVDADHDGRADRMSVEKLEMASSFLRGVVKGGLSGLSGERRFEGFTGEFFYVPEKLGMVLAPWLPGKLEGTEEQRVGFSIEGPVKEASLLGLLRNGTVQGKMGCDHYTTEGLKISGTLSTSIKDGFGKLEAPLSANDGTVSLVAEGDFRDTPLARSTVAVTVRDVQANREMGPLLSKIHPVFYHAEGTVRGVVTAELNGAWSGPLHPDLFRDGLSLIRRSLTGRGKVHIARLEILRSTFLNELLAFLENDGGPVEGELTVEDLRIQDGRVSYEGLVLRLKRNEIRFNGWIDFDERMELTMLLPLTEKMARRYKLDRYVGTMVSIPVKGTLSHPRLDWQKVLEELAQKELRDKLLDRLNPFKKDK